MKIALASFLIQQFQPIDAYTYGLYSQEPDCIVMREEIRMEMTVRLNSHPTRLPYPHKLL